MRKKYSLSQNEVNSIADGEKDIAGTEIEIIQEPFVSCKQLSNEARNEGNVTFML